MFARLKVFALILTFITTCAVFGNAASLAQRDNQALAEKVRTQLVTIPSYGVFDWLDFQVQPDDTVVLRGQVRQPITKSDAESRLRKIESIAKVVNQIEVLPLSSEDDRIRLQAYRSIYRFDSPLFQYSVRPVPPIHIIVRNGHVWLKGAVLNSMDSQLAYNAAFEVPGVFDVENQLAIESKQGR